MSQIQDYKEYKKYQPEYKDWKAKRDENLNRKIAYLKDNPIKKDEYEKNIEHAKIVLNAVDVMDEYSQSRAEETEQVTESVVSVASTPMSYISLALGALGVYLTKDGFDIINEAFKGNFKRIGKLTPAALAFILPISIFSIFTSIWSAKKEVQASRRGRQEAMTNDLASLNQFAVLDEKQKAEVEKIANTITVDKKEAKKIINSQRGLGILESIKEIFSKDDTKKYIADVKMNNNILTNEEILEAKKDKELIQNVVEKIDIASQDYSENAELTIGTLSTIGTSGGVLVGFLTNLITKHIKPLAKHSNIISTIVGAGLAIATVVLGAKIQKQASRVGRFKVKQELLNNPEPLLYVDEEKYKNTQPAQTEAKKIGFISRAIQLFKDNKEYNEYIKNNNVRNIQLRKAKEQIKLTGEQKVRAKQLQQNTFNMFNKLDEKSQRYSESAEALGNTITSTVSSLIMMPGMMLSMIASMGAKTKKGAIGGLMGYLGSLLIPIILNIIMTKDQKNASRVANMQAIKELDDYRYFAHNSETNKSQQSNQTSPFDIFLKK